MKNIKLFSTEGKVALITGGVHGLGMSMAKAIGEAGATIVVNSLSKDRVDKAVEQYREWGISAHGYVFNVADEVAVNKSISQIEVELGNVDILVNNAGIIKRTPLVDMSVEDWRAVIDIDLTSPFIVSKRVVNGMIERRGGKIINICSMMSELGRSGVSAYAAAKGGLKMLTKNMATEWANYNIQVNGIGPGYFATSQTAPIRVEGHPFNEFIVNRTPAGRWGDPEDLEGAAIFLSSRASDFVNGQIIYVDGGILATIGKPADE
jgi:gluconate 5-dehydrogenase